MLQILANIPGVRALFAHITAPGVRRVEVLKWKSDDQQDTVPHTALCHTCPDAEVVYTKDEIGRQARRIDE